MQSHEIHHIKAYIVFSMLSVVFIGLLAYLYLPAEIVGDIKSSFFGGKVPDTIELPQPVQKVETDNQETDTVNADISNRRIRLAKILLRTQKELQTLEDQRKSSPQGLDAMAEEKITKLRAKIANIEKMITEIK